MTHIIKHKTLDMENIQDIDNFIFQHHQQFENNWFICPMSHPTGQYRDINSKMNTLIKMIHGYIEQPQVVFKLIEYDNGESYLRFEIKNFDMIFRGEKLDNSFKFLNDYDTHCDKLKIILDSVINKLQTYPDWQNYQVKKILKQKLENELGSPIISITPKKHKI